VAGAAGEEDAVGQGPPLLGVLLDAGAEVIKDTGYANPVRTPRGEDIMAACGQLKSESVRERKSVRDAAAAAH
jgi:23S rRNA (adenine2503-C2)-methyltransferase